MDDSSPFPRSESRRSILKKGALATAGAAALGASTGAAAGQADDDGEGEGEGIDEGNLGRQKALVFQDSIRPTAWFVIVSDVIDWIPNVEEVTDNIWSDYNTRVIRYLNTGERVLLFVAENADVGRYDDDLGYVVDEEDGDDRQPKVYAMDRQYTLIDDAPQLVTVNFGDLGEDEEDDALDDEDWWRPTGGNNADVDADDPVVGRRRP